PLPDTHPLGVVRSRPAAFPAHVLTHPGGPMPLPGAFRARPVLAIVALTFAAGCANQSTTPSTSAPPAAKQAAAAPQPPQLFKGLGSHTRTVSTTNEDAQTYFNQALIWTFSFNHDEAIRSYQKAADLDPNLAFAYWGIALCNGPHINNPVM